MKHILWNKNDYNYKFQERKTKLSLMFSENKVFDYKIIIFLLYTLGKGEGGSRKAYLLYTYENIDKCEQPLNILL